MAYGFGTTYGTSNTTDRLQSADATCTTLCSYSIWSYRVGSGATFGTMISKRTTDNVTRSRIWLHRTDTFRYDFIAQWSTAAATWGITVPTGDVWVNHVITYDGGSTANDPIIYENGSSVTVNEITAPTGTLSASTADVHWYGNRDAADRAWGGMICEIARWDRILTADEAAAIGGDKFSPLWFRNGLRGYLPLIRGSADWLNGASTVTGALVQNHPRIIYPKSRRIFAPAAVASFNAAWARNSNTVISQVMTP